MKLMKSLVTLVLVLILGASVYWLVYKPDRMESLQRVKEKFLVQFDVSTIEGFTLGRPDSSIVIEKGFGNIWNIIEPVIDEAENEEIIILFNNLRTAEILFIVEDSDDNLSNYGLDNPSHYLAIKYADGYSDTLFTGLNSPDGSMTYVKLSSDDRVVTVDRNIAEYLKKPTRAYRARTLLNVFETDITGIELIRETDNTITLTTNGQSWAMSSPWPLPGDQQNIEEVVNSVTETRKSHFIAESTDDLSQYGLDNPSLVVRVSLSKGMPDKLLLVGNKLGERGSEQLYSYAKQFDKDVIFTVQNMHMKNFTMDPFWYIYKHPMTFNRELVNRIVIETAGNNIVIVRGAQNYWSVVEPVDMNIDEDVISNIFGITRFMAIRDVYAFDPSPENNAATGLDQPRARITFYQNDTMLDWVDFGDSFTEDEENTYFRTSARPAIYITRALVSEKLSLVLNTLFNNQ